MVKISDISKKYNVSIVFQNLTDGVAWYTHTNKTITIDKKYQNKRNKLIPIIFHELGHKYCYERNLFNAYHWENDLGKILKTGLKAERFVDKWAANEMKINGIRIKYPYFYNDKTCTKWFKIYLKNKFKIDKVCL